MDKYRTATLLSAEFAKCVAMQPGIEKRNPYFVASSVRTGPDAVLYGLDKPEQILDELVKARDQAARRGAD